MSNRKPDLCAMVREQIVRYIRKANLQKNARLPSENQLAEKFQVSRGTIRTVLAMLEDEGKVIRRHGSGTYVNQYAFELTATLYPQVYFSDLIRLNGYNSSIELLGARLIKAGLYGERLDMPPSHDVFEVKKVYRADGEACIYCVDYLNPEHFHRYERNALLSALNSEGISIFQFLDKYADIQVVWDAVRLKATNSMLVPELFAYAAEPCSYLMMESVNYDGSDKPVLYGQSYVNTDIIKYYIVRGRYDKEGSSL